MKLSQKDGDMTETVGPVGIEHRYFVIRMEVDVDDNGLLDDEYNRVVRVEDQLRDMFGYENARKANANAIVKEVFPPLTHVAQY